MGSSVQSLRPEAASGPDWTIGLLTHDPERLDTLVLKKEAVGYAKVWPRVQPAGDALLLQHIDDDPLAEFHDATFGTHSFKGGKTT